MERDRFFTAAQAVEYGLCDRVLHLREDTPGRRRAGLG